MKTVIIIINIVLLSTFNTETHAENKKVTETNFKVEGVCNMCEERIENAAYIKGVKFCEWNKETKMLKVIYKPAKVSELEIHKSIAKAGHETNKVKASEKAYKELPGCCAYKDGVETH